MNNYIYKNVKIKHLLLPLNILAILITAFVIRTILENKRGDATYLLSIIVFLLCFISFLLIRTLYESFNFAPHSILEKNEELVFKFFMKTEIIKKKNIVSLTSLSPFLTATFFPIKINVKELGKYYLLPYSLQPIKPVIESIRQVNPDCKIEISFKGEDVHVLASEMHTFFYPWEKNLVFTTIILIFGIFLTYGILDAMLETNTYYLFLPAIIFALLTISYFKSYLLFFFCAPHEIKLNNGFLEIKIGFNKIKKIPISYIEKIFFQGGLYQLFCISTEGGNIYFTSDLRNYKQLISDIKKQNSMVEIDVKSINNAEKKK